MTVSRIKVRLPTKFPSSVSAASPILLDKSGGAFAFSLDMDAIHADFDGQFMAASSVQGTANQITATYVGSNVTLSFPAAMTLTGKTVTGGTFTGGLWNKVTITAPATAATLTLIDGTTLTGPAASGTVMTLGNAETVTGVKTFGSAGAVGRLKVAGTTSGGTILDATAVASGTLTLPAATDTLVGKATTDTLTNKTFDTSGTGNVLQIGSATVTRGQIPGETTTGSAAAGYVGEYISSTIVQGSAVALTAGTPANVTSISLTAGDWDVSLDAHFFGSTTTTVQYLEASISTTSVTLNETPGNAGIWTAAFASSTPFNFGRAASADVIVPVPLVRLSLASTTTVFFVAQSLFATSTCSVFGLIRARRVR